MTRPMDEREHHEAIMDVIRAFFQAYREFKAQRKTYEQQEIMPFAKVNAFVEQQVFKLKEDCHHLFRLQPEHSARVEHEDLFDLLVGSIFHELMKIKENAYQLERYAPRFAALARSGTADGGGVQRAIVGLSEKLLKRAKEGLEECLGDAQELFRDAADFLRTMLRGYQDNGLLTRFLLENRELLEEAYGGEPLNALLRAMYDGDLEAAYLVAARSYSDGGWHEKSRAYLEKILAIDPSNTKAAALLRDVG